MSGGLSDQSGRVAVVTGATNGIGYHTALGLAGAGATVVLAARDAARGEDAVRRIRARHSGAAIEVELLDLASLASVASFAERVLARHPRVDLLINNAGIMGVNPRATTADGFELMLGVNYLGHFALTARLLPALRDTPGARVVAVSSIAHRRATLRLDDLQSERGYRSSAAYGQSKLAMLVFALELERRARAGGWALCSLAAHPGLSATNIAAVGPRVGRTSPSLLERVATVVLPIVAQSSAAGAQPTLHAATAPDAGGGSYWGPDRLLETRGAPAPARIMPQASDPVAAKALWERSEALIGLRFPA